ncbi:hypothetical protein AVO44_04930 [Ruegeria profundi]|uniref:Uncharacterized protein n=1 Tax=Ruegeria profundi TaxID=1685378 RepID=A0A0X3TZP7_9RHOB|nr:hypothetical protein AVO44_04930 [Ruegeria profundi]
MDQPEKPQPKSYHSVYDSFGKYLVCCISAKRAILSPLVSTLKATNAAWTKLYMPTSPNRRARQTFETAQPDFQGLSQLHD